MNNDHLATYLNDHLAGSVVAIELLDYVIESHPELRSTVTSLREEIQVDRQELERLISDFGVSQSSPRKVLAWTSEKALRAKLWFDGDSDGQLRLLEAMEVVSLGIEGKKALWKALSAASTSRPQLREIQFERLERRADEQRQVAESIRLAAARRAFGDVELNGSAALGN